MGVVHSQAAMTVGYPDQKGGFSSFGDKGDNSFMGDHGDSNKIIVPKFGDDHDVAKWIFSLDSKDNRGNVFDALVEGCSPKDLGIYLPKSELKILSDIQFDVKDVEKDFDKLAKDDHGGKSFGSDKFSFKDGHDDPKDLYCDIKFDLTDIKKDVYDFAGGLKDGCHHDPCDPTPPITPGVSAVPLPAAASQGLIGLAVLGCLSLMGGFRRRVFGRA